MAGLFAHTVRPAMLAASRADGLRRVVEHSPVTRRVVRRFVPGETLDSVLGVVAALRDSGRYVSIDYLGETSPTFTTPPKRCGPTWSCWRRWAGGPMRRVMVSGRSRYR